MRKLSSLFSLFLLLFLGLQSNAQTSISTIKGKVRSTDKPVESATASLHKASDSVLIKMNVTNKEGDFIFENIPTGRYLVQISAIGFDKSWSKPLDITDQSTIDLGSMLMNQATSNLAGVTVTARKPMVEQKLDKTIVNVEGQATNVGISALEVLEKSPGITVDKDGNISLKGKAGVMILIDGKPTYMSGTDLANYLRNLPSSQLELLEIMTNPPAKYDAAGNAGIINIKTKKNKATGYNGAVTIGGGMGNLPKSNSSINLNYRNKQWNIFGNYAYNYNENFQDLRLTRNFRDQNTGELLSIFDQAAYMNKTNKGHTAKVGVDFYATKKTTLGVVVNGFYSNNENLNQNTTNIKDPAGNLNTRTEAENDIAMQYKNVGVNFNMRHQFDSTGRELTADIDVLSYDNANVQNLTNFFYDKNGAKQHPDEFIYGNLPSQINIYSAKMDYVQPLKNKAKLEAGFKTSYVKTDNDAQYANLNTSSGEWKPDASRSNHFIYTENINAAYVNMSKEFNKKWSAQLGLRLENTHAKGEQLTTDQDFDRNYTQLFPTAFIQYSANEKNQFSLNYGRRIERPDYEDMNPFYYFLDKYTYQVGNPNLKPQFANNIELSHSYAGWLTTTLNYTNTVDLITEVIRQIDSTNTTFITKDNVARKMQTGISVNAGIPITKWWRTNIYFNGFYNEYSGVVNDGYLETSLMSWMTNIQNQFTFKKGWSAEISGFYRSKMQEGVLVAEPMGAINFAVSKKMMKDKATLRLNFRDPFDLQYFHGYSQYQNIDMQISNHWDNRVVNASFTYRFGKPAKGPSPRKSGGAGEEQNRVRTESN